MFDTVVVATDGSGSVSRAVDCALDLAAEFDAAVHALYVAEEPQTAPESGPDVRAPLDERGEAALGAVREANRARPEPVELETAVRAGCPAEGIVGYVRDVDADAVAMGTRGRSGDHSFLLGSVAERVVRTCPVPVLTVRQLET